VGRDKCEHASKLSALTLARVRLLIRLPTIAAVGAIIGLGISLSIEWIARLRGEVGRLQGIEAERDAVREQGERLRQLLEFQVQVAQREAAINLVHMKVYADAFIEVGGTQRLPADALLARIAVSTKAENLDAPLESPKP
jgi:precorrin-6B methylase 2